MNQLIKDAYLIEVQKEHEDLSQLVELLEQAVHSGEMEPVHRLIHDIKYQINHIQSMDLLAREKEGVAQ